MPNIKFSDLPVITTVALTDLVPVVTDPAGTPAVENITIDEFRESLFSGAKIHQTGATSVNTGGVALVFAGESWDTDGFHDNVTNNTRITIPVTGLYEFSAQMKVSANAVTGIRVRLGGSTIIAGTSRGNGGSPEYCQVYGQYEFTAGQYIEFIGFCGSTQNTSGDVETYALIRRLK